MIHALYVETSFNAKFKFFMKFLFENIKKINYLGFRLKCIVSEISKTWITLIWLLISNFARLKWKTLFESGVVSLYWAREKFRVELEKLHRNSLLGARIRLVSQTDLLVDPGGGAGIVRDEFFGFEPKADLVVGGLNRVCQTVKKLSCQFRH